MLQFDTWTAARELKEKKKNFAKRLSLLRLVTTVFFLKTNNSFLCHVLKHGLTYRTSSSLSNGTESTETSTVGRTQTFGVLSLS